MFLRSYTLFLIAVFIGSVNAFAQNPTPTPVATPAVKDKQDVEPDKLQGVPAIAPNYRSDDKSLPDLGRVGVDMTDQQSLTLAEAITKALENNKDIEVTRKNVKVAEFDLKAARGYYEPKFSGQAYYERAKTPVFSFFGGGPNFSLTQSNIVGNAGINGAFRRTGATYSVTANNGRNTTNNIFTSVNPTYTSSLSFQFTQPLLRGRRFDQPRRAIEIAKRNLSLTDTQFRQRTIETIANVQRAYWDLTYALRNLQVQRDGVKDAKDQLEHNKRLVDEGQLAPIDVLAAETQVANFEQSVYDALNVVGTAENNLKNLISPNRNDAIWGRSVTPVDSVDLAPPVTTLSQAIDAAMQNRPELEINQAQKDINALDQRFYKEQGKPQIDLVANYTLTGSAGTFNPNVVNPFSGTGTTTAINQLIRNNNLLLVTNPGLTPIDQIPVTQTPTLPDSLNGGYGGALGNLFANRYPTLRVGVQFNLPLFGDRTSRAQYGKSLVEGEKLNVQREQLEQNIQVDVRNALQSLRTAEARLRAAAIARENSVKQYESEQRKLDNGQSDIYKVLERQTALTTARSNELRAQTELNKSIADLQRATGNSLKANNVEARLQR
ncbi:MAG: TolC family protein [Acidobacteria bacterium]|nr:TolC family protein [Acidobacteriota bacterium]